jgi:hypothetical protein
MPTWINQNSFVLAAAATILVAAVLLLRDGIRPSDLLALAALAVGMWAAHALLRPPAGSGDEVSAIRAQIGAGKAVLLEFQSPY